MYRNIQVHLAGEAWEDEPGPRGGFLFEGWAAPHFIRTVEKTIAAAVKTTGLFFLAGRRGFIMVNQKDSGLLPNAAHGNRADSPGPDPSRPSPHIGSSSGSFFSRTRQ
jgi:hypothetical protein